MALSPAAESKLRLIVLPSKAITSPPVVSLIALVQLMKHRLKASESIRENTRRNVSWLGIPLGNSKCFLNHSSLAHPKSYMSTKLVAPQITAQTAMNRMSINE